MTSGGRVTALVLRWCALYTRGLPADVAADRRDELASDLHDHRLAALGQARSTFPRDVLRRALLGVPADLSWRTHQRRIARSAREPEVVMTARAPLDGWTRTAYGVAAIVTAWTALIGIGMLIDSRNAAVGSYDFQWRIGLGVVGVVMLALCVHALMGLRSHPVRAAVELGATAVVMTIWMMWAGLVVAVGIAAMAFFAAYAVRSRRTARTGVAAPA
ncbi:hypothetical protein [Longivirga aurantiaca]|uniref:Uncharacterized protein n=1 Tax=Longivirga aurantiaca TaxID=1837743 RepID=A0ABW1T521_9ACTN